MTLIETIKAIPMTDVLDRLKLEYYHKSGQEYGMIENGKKTDGWGFNVGDNLMCNHTPSKQYRPQGSNIDVVMWRENCDTSEAIQRFKDEYDLVDEEKFESKTEFPEHAKKYMQGRGIDYNKVKDVVQRKNGILVGVYLNGIKQGGAIRTLSSDPKKRFLSVTGTKGNAVYMKGKDEKDKKMFIVEGMFDFLTLRQHTKNVIGLRSAKNGIEEALRLCRGHDVIIVPHNDEAGKEMTKAFEGIDHRVFNVGDYGDYNDLNDLYVDLGMGEDVLLGLVDGSKGQSAIDKLFEKLERQVEKLERDGMLGIPGPYPLLENHISGRIPGTVVTLGAPVTAP